MREIVSEEGHRKECSEMTTLMGIPKSVGTMIFPSMNDGTTYPGWLNFTKAIYQI